MTDNLSTHRDRQALDPLHQAGVTVRFLPAYSPHYNPIEMMWSKVKSIPRKTEARDNGSLLLAIGDALNQVTQKNAPIGLVISATNLFKMP